MSSRDVCCLCETNYVLQDDARCGICEECEAVLDEEHDRRTNFLSASSVFVVDPSVALTKNAPDFPVRSLLRERDELEKTVQPDP